MKSVGCTQRRPRQGQEEVLRPTMHVAGQLDAPVHIIVEASDDGMLHAARNLPRERALTETTRQCGDDLGHR